MGPPKEKGAGEPLTGGAAAAGDDAEGALAPKLKDGADEAGFTGAAADVFLAGAPKPNEDVDEGTSGAFAGSVGFAGAPKLKEGVEAATAVVFAGSSFDEVAGAAEGAPKLKDGAKEGAGALAGSSFLANGFEAKVGVARPAGAAGIKAAGAPSENEFKPAGLEASVGLSESVDAAGIEVGVLLPPSAAKGLDAAGFEGSGALVAEVVVVVLAAAGAAPNEKGLVAATGLADSAAVVVVDEARAGTATDAPQVVVAGGLETDAEADAALPFSTSLLSRLSIVSSLRRFSSSPTARCMPVELPSLE